MASALWEAARAGDTAEASRLLDEGAPVEWRNEAAVRSCCHCVAPCPLPRAWSAMQQVTRLSPTSRAAALRIARENMWGGPARGGNGSVFTARWAPQGGSREVTPIAYCEGCVWWGHVSSQGGCTALVKASQGGHKDTVELLLDHGADLEAKTRVSAAAVCYCATGRSGRRGRAKGAAVAMTCGRVVLLWRAGV